MLSGSGLAGPKAHQGARFTLVLSNQPSLYSVHWPNISTYWVRCREGAPVLDAHRPRHHHVLAHATEPGGVLLEPTEGGVEGPGPACQHLVVGLIGAPDVVEPGLHLHRQFVETLEEGHLIGVPNGPPSALMPLSPLMLMLMIRVLSSLPRSSNRWITRPIS